MTPWWAPQMPVLHSTLPPWPGLLLLGFVCLPYFLSCPFPLVLVTLCYPFSLYVKKPRAFVDCLVHSPRWNFPGPSQVPVLMHLSMVGSSKSDRLSWFLPGAVCGPTKIKSYASGAQIQSQKRVHNKHGGGEWGAVTEYDILVIYGMRATGRSPCGRIRRTHTCSFPIWLIPVPIHHLPQTIQGTDQQWPTSLSIPFSLSISPRFRCSEPKHVH